MYLIKKVFVIILILSFILQTIALQTIAFAESFDQNDDNTEISDDAVTTATPNDVISSVAPTDVALEQAISVLTGLGIFKGYTDGNFMPEATITRAEFSAIITRMLGLEEAESIKGKVSFADVPEDYWAVGNINAIYKMAIIDGYGDGRFGPEDEVQYQQAVKVIVSALGYTLQAKEKGGYPAGYLIVAGDKGITKGVNTAADKPVTRGDIARLVYNALEVDLMQQTGFGDNVQYTVTKDKNLLTERLDIVKATGQIISTEETRLSGYSRLKAGQVEIDGQVYNTGTTGAEKLLGYRVTYYAKDNKSTGEYDLAAVLPEQGKNDILTVKADDILYQDSEFTSNCFIYQDKDEDRKKANISLTADVVFNGKAYGLPDKAVFNIQLGQVKLLDSDNDGQYDVIFIDSYVNYVVKDIYTDLKTVGDQYKKDGNQVLLELDDKSDQYELIMEKDGGAIEFGDLKAWNILSVFESINSGKKLRKVMVTDQKVTGAIEELGSDTMVVAGKEYDIAADYAGTNHIGDEGTFYLDIQGKIAGADIPFVVQEQIALIYDMILLDGLGSPAEIKLLNAKNEWVIYKTKDEIEYNGRKKPVVSDDVYGDLTETAYIYKDPNGNSLVSQTDPNVQNKYKGRVCKKQLINYKVDGNGILTSITTSGGTPDVKDSIQLSEPNNYLFNADDMSFASKVYVNNSVLIFRIPTYGKQLDDTQYGLVKTDYFWETTYKIITANTSDFGVPKAMVVQEDYSTTVSNSSSLMIVESITTIVNEEGDKVQKLTGFAGGAAVTLQTEKENLMGDVRSGDIIQIRKNLKGKIISYLKRFTGKDKGITKGWSGNYDADPRFVYGVIADVDETKTYVKIDAGNDFPVQNVSYSKAYIYEYDATKEKAAVVKKVNFQKGMAVYLRLDTGRLLDAIIYKI